MKQSSYRFSQRVDNYIQYRPRYPTSILDLLKAECQLSPTHQIADLGSGTGLLAELFLANGNVVWGIEPDAGMRAGAESYLQSYPRFTSIAGQAEVTTLPDQSVDFATVGQAFHWFDLAQTKREMQRILVPDGWVVLVWNIQRTRGKPFLEALQRFWKNEAHWKSPTKQATQRQAQAQAYRLDRQLARQELLEPFFGLGQYREASYETPMVCDFVHLSGRVLSNGPALEPEDSGYEKMLDTLRELFDRYQQDGTVTIDHDTWVVYGKLNQSNVIG